MLIRKFLVEKEMKNIDPLYDMATYQGRFRHFFRQQNPLNLFENEDEAREILDRVKSEKVVKNLEEYWNAKYVYDSSHHPVTGEKVNIFGRMSFQAPGNMFLTAFMVTFYKNPAAVVSLQFLNQSFNSNVNFSNSAAAVSVPSLIQKKISFGCPRATRLFRQKKIGQVPKLSDFARKVSDKKSDN